MTQQDQGLTITQRLGQLLDQGLLPAGGPAEAAERLIERLERPARIALLGLPGAGKSAVLNLLCGTVVVPENLRLPTIIVQHRTEARMQCTLADGRVQTVPGHDMAQVLKLNPALVTLEMDLPALKVISLLEVSAGPMEADQRRAAVWASKRADILIWCTTSYLPKEQQVWEGMPDAVKDNSFLFLTKIDLLGSKVAARGLLDRVEQRAGEEFRQVLALSAKEARAAMQAPGGLDAELFRESGAGTVISTIKSRVQMARRADTDTAELLLARHQEASGLVAKRFADPGSPAERAPTAEPAWQPPPDAAEEPARPAVVETRAEAPPAPPMPEPEPAPPEPVAEAMPDPVVEPLPEPKVEPLPEPKPDSRPQPRFETRAERRGQPRAEPRIEPPVPPRVEPKPEPVLHRAPAPEPPVTQPTAADLAAGGRKRFTDRIKSMPMPEEAAAAPVPLRSTWKSKSDPAMPERAVAPPVAAPTPRTLQPSSAPPPVVQDGAPLVPEVEDAPVASDLGTTSAAPDLAEEVARVVAAAALRAADETETIEEEESGADAGPADPEPEAEPEPETDETAPDDARIAAMLANIAKTRDAAPVERAERPMPTNSSPPAERSARTSLFGARRDPAPLAPEPAAPMARTPAAGRPGEPLRRVSAPMPRPVETPAARSVAFSPEDLAKPRLVPGAERRVEGQPAETVARVERRERPRIARVVTEPAAAPAVARVAVPVSSVEQEMAEAAIGILVRRASELAVEVAPAEKIPMDLILEHARETTEQTIAQLARATSPDMRRINSDLGEVLDLIMLMQLEKGHAPADDALTLLLQIRRDLETLRPL